MPPAQRVLSASGPGCAPRIKDTGALCHVCIHVTSFVFLPAATPAKVVSTELGDFSGSPGTEQLIQESHIFSCIDDAKGCFSMGEHKNLFPASQGKKRQVGVP
jgi:hypothetical protein